MKIGILSTRPKSYSVRRLKEASRTRGHTVRVLDPGKFAIALEPDRLDVIYASKPLSRYDAVIPRIGASASSHGTALIRQLEKLGTFTTSSSFAVDLARDKLRSLQAVANRGVQIPATVLVRDYRSVQQAVERVGGPPVVLKVLRGTHGVGVVLADTLKVAEAMIQALGLSEQEVLVQRFVAESRGRDVRAFVVGDRVVAAMRRIADGDEFRSNLHRGGRAEAVTLPDDVERMAVRASRIVGLRVSGVDLLEGAEGALVTEVNASPGLEGIEGTTGIDVAGAIVEHIEQEISLTDMDVVEKLTLDGSHVVASVHVSRNSELVGKTFVELGFAEQGIQVLTVQRGTTPIRNPQPNLRLAPGDDVICYGPLRSLKLYAKPTPRSRTRRPSVGLTTPPSVGPPPVDRDG